MSDHMWAGADAQTPPSRVGDGVTHGRRRVRHTLAIEPLTGQGTNLALATWTFAINFWAWNLIAPLSTDATRRRCRCPARRPRCWSRHRSWSGRSGRIPVGALTDRYGGRLMFTVMSFVSIVPVLLVAFAGAIDSYPLLLVFGFFLGIAGTAFADRHSVRQRLVPARPPRLRHRRVRCRHGRHRPVGVLHAALRGLVRLRRDARDHRGRAGADRGCWSWRG